MPISATEAKVHFGRMLDTAQREPVTIEKNGRAFAVMLSKHDYDLLLEELQELRSWAETAFLMRGKNAERLMQSIREIETGQTIEKTFAEIEAMSADED